ncbi:MAG: LysR family transcriptional regulator [Pseudomonadota bacterium]
MSDRLEEMATFVRVVEAGSLTGAARRLEVAKSAVSRRLAELEGRLGVQLLRRTTRTLHLTDAGRAFYQRCVRILADVDEAELAVSDVHGRLAGQLRVAAPLSFGIAHLQPAVDAFMAEHPDVRFDLDLDDRQVDLMAENFDLGIRIAPLADSSLVARRLATVDHVVCASPDYLARHGAPQTPAELADHDCLTYANAPASDTWSCIDAQGREQRVAVRSRLRANNGDLLREVALAGRGIVFQPRFIVHRALAAGTLVPVLTDCDWSRVDAWALYPQTRHLSARVRAFVDFLVDWFAVPPWEA